MGTIKKGILGGFSGSVGPVIGGSWKGIEYMRSQPSKRSGSSTAAQIEQQLKFSLMMHFLQTMTELFDETFRNYAIEMSAFNAAFSYNIKNAVTGTSPDFEVDYQHALVSRGDLPNAASPKASVTSNTVFYTWADNSGAGSALPTDEAVLAVYCKDMNSAVYSIGSAARSAGAASIDAAIFTGKEVNTWLGFISQNGKEVANSIYTGALTVS